MKKSSKAASSGNAKQSVFASSVGIGFAAGFTGKSGNNPILHDVTVNDTDVQFQLLKLNKASATTKVKALKTLADLFKDRNSKQLKDIVPGFVWYFNKLSMDDSRHVREGLYECLTVIIEVSKKSLASHMISMFGNWWMHQYDNSKEVASASRNAFSLAFSEDKRDNVLSHCLKDFITFISKKLNSSIDTLSDRKLISAELAEERFNRVIASCYCSFGGFISSRSKDDNKKSVTEYESVLTSSSIILKRITYKNSAMIRRSVYTMLKDIITHCPHIIMNDIKNYSPLILSSFSEEDKVNHFAMWNLILHFCKHMPECWLHVKPSKAIFPRLFKALKTAGYGNGEGWYPFIVTFLKCLPDEVLGIVDNENNNNYEIAVNFYDRLLGAIWDGTDIARCIVGTFNNQAVECFIEVCIFGTNNYIAHDKLCIYISSQFIQALREQFHHLQVDANKRQRFIMLSKEKMKLSFVQKAGKSLGKILKESKNVEMTRNIWTNVTETLQVFYDNIDICNKNAYLLGDFIVNISEYQLKTVEFCTLVSDVVKKITYVTVEIPKETLTFVLKLFSICPLDVLFPDESDILLFTQRINKVLNSLLLQGNKNDFTLVFEILSKLVINDTDSVTETMTIFASQLEDKKQVNNTILCGLTCLFQFLGLHHHHVFDSKLFQGMINNILQLFLRCKSSEEYESSLVLYEELLSFLVTNKSEKCMEMIITQLVNKLHIFLEEYKLTKSYSSVYCGDDKVSFLSYQFKKKTKTYMNNIPHIIHILSRFLSIGNEDGTVSNIIFPSKQASIEILFYLRYTTYVSLYEQESDVTDVTDNKLFDVISNSANEAWQIIHAPTVEQNPNLLYVLAKELQKNIEQGDTDYISWSFQSSQLILTCSCELDRQRLIEYILPSNSTLEMIINNNIIETKTISIIFHCIYELLVLLGTDVLFYMDKNNNSRSITLILFLAMKQMMDYMAPISYDMTARQLLRELNTSIQNKTNEDIILTQALDFFQNSKDSSLLSKSTYGLAIQFALTLQSCIKKAFAKCICEPLIKQEESKSNNNNSFTITLNWLCILDCFRMVLSAQDKQDNNMKKSFIMIASILLKEIKNNAKNNKNNENILIVLHLIFSLLPCDYEGKELDELLEEACSVLNSENASLNLLGFLGSAWNVRKIIIIPYVLDKGNHTILCDLIINNLKTIIQSIKSDDKITSRKLQNKHELSPYSSIIREISAILDNILPLSEAMLLCNKELFSELFNYLFELLVADCISFISVQANKHILCMWARCIKLVLLELDDSTANNVIFMNKITNLDISKNTANQQYSIPLRAPVLQLLRSELYELVLVGHMIAECYMNILAKKVKNEYNNDNDNINIEKKMDITAVIPRDILCIISSPSSIDVKNNKEQNDYYDSDIVELLNSTEYTKVYFICWKLLLDIFVLLPEHYQINIAKYLHKHQLNHHLMNLSFEYFHTEDASTIKKCLSLSSSQFWDQKLNDNDNTQEEDEQVDDDHDFLIRLAISNYISALGSLPMLSRAWFMNMKNIRGIKSQIKDITTNYFSPGLLDTQLESVRNAYPISKTVEYNDYDDDEDHKTTVSVSKVGSQIVANYTRDDISVDLIIRLPDCFPLEPNFFEFERLSQLNSSQAIKLIREEERLLNHRNGAIVDAIKAWERDILSVYAGVEECSICQYIINEYRKTPNYPCKQCKKKFHSSCLFEWFESSGKSQCPLCRAYL